MLVMIGSIRRHRDDVESARLYPVNFKNRKRAITWLLKKLERERPGCHEYAAEIIEEHTDGECNAERTMD